MFDSEKEELRRESTHLVRRNILACLEKVRHCLEHKILLYCLFSDLFCCCVQSLEKESDEELLKLTKFIEGCALLDEDKFQVQLT